jgi:flagellar biosynthetic protein FlhB
MAESSNAEKTEPASAKRLRDARANGDIPRSREVATFTVLMTAGAGLWMLGGGVLNKLSTTLERGLSLDREQIYNPNVLIERVTSDISGVILACLPLAIAIMLWPWCRRC